MKDVDGKERKLSDFKDKWVVLEWTNKDCPYVRKHYKSGNMQATQKKAREMGAVWFIVLSSAEGEQVRTGLNNWIKTSGAFDGVIDFAAAVADAKDPLTIASQYNIRDHLHPNDAGYKAMAEAIDLGLFKAVPASARTPGQ